MSGYESPVSEKWTEGIKDAVTGPVEGPAENIRVEGPFTKSDIIVAAQFEFKRLGAGAFIGEEFEEDRIERKMRKGMEKRDQLFTVETDPDIMTVTAFLYVPIPTSDVEHISSILENLDPNSVLVDKYR